MPYPIFSKLAHHRLMPVIELDSADDALHLAEAFLQGGLPLLEVTFRTNAAPQAIGAIRQRFPEMLVGAGTIITRDHLHRALDASAQFLVSPGFERTLTEAILESDTPYLPGVATPSDLQGALALGVTQCKFFPAEGSGGTRALRVLATTFRALAPTFVPTGGINLNNLEVWLKEPAVIAVGGSWLAAKQWIRDRDWAAIRESVATSVRIAQSVIPT
jgi:2-dehydro-3-deoxyphosphogluconate aldolase / (4S)-4-hydroxy-2-oxoglutarate aldolase